MIIQITGEIVILECKEGGHSQAMDMKKALSISPMSQEVVYCAGREQYQCKEFIMAHKFTRIVREMKDRGETYFDTETGEVK